MRNSITAGIRGIDTPAAQGYGCRAYNAGEDVVKEFKIQVPDDVGQAVEKAAQETGKTVDEVFAEAAKRDMGRRWMDKLKREGDVRRGNMTDDEVDAVVNKAIEEDRQEYPRSR